MPGSGGSKERKLPVILTKIERQAFRFLSRAVIIVGKADKLLVPCIIFPIEAMKFIFLTLLLCAGIVSSLVAEESKTQYNILILTGGHGFEKADFCKMFDEMTNIRYDLAELPKEMDLLAPGLEKKYDLLLSYDMNNFPMSEEQRKNFAKLIESGMPLLVMHHSLCGHDDWPLYWQMVGGKYLHSPTTIGGKSYGVSSYKHDLDIPVRIVDKEHPITKGVEDFTIRDEGYKNMYIREGIHVLLTTDHPDATVELGWTTRYGKGPIFAIALGHDRHAFANPQLRRLLYQGIGWCITESRKQTLN